MKKAKAPDVRSNFRSCDGKKVYAVVARSTFASGTFRSCDVEKIQAGCGAKHISNSNCTKHTNVRPLLEVAMSKKCTPLRREAHLQVALLEVAMSKKCTPLWREAHFAVKSAKNEGYGALLDVQLSFCVAGDGDCAPFQR